MNKCKKKKKFVENSKENKNGKQIRLLLQLYTKQQQKKRRNITGCWTTKEKNSEI